MYQTKGKRLKMFKMMLIVSALLGGLAFTGCERSPAQKVGDKIEKAAEKTGDAIKEGAEKAKDAVK